MELKNCDILLYKSNGDFFPNAICKITKSEFCHIGALIDSGNAKTVAEAQTKKFQVADYGTDLDNLIAKKQIRVMRLKNKFTAKQEKEAIKFANNSIGKKYGFFDIASVFIYTYTHLIFLKKTVQDYICSEWVVYFLQYLGVDLEVEFQKPARFITPADFPKSKYLEWI